MSSRSAALICCNLALKFFRRYFRLEFASISVFVLGIRHRNTQQRDITESLRIHMKNIFAHIRNTSHITNNHSECLTFLIGQSYLQCQLLLQSSLLDATSVDFQLLVPQEICRDQWQFFLHNIYGPIHPLVFRFLYPR